RRSATPGCGTCSVPCSNWSRRRASRRRTHSNSVPISRWRPTRSSTPPERSNGSVLEYGGAALLAGRHGLFEIARRDTDEELRGALSVHMRLQAAGVKAVPELSLGQLHPGPAPAV